MINPCFSFLGAVKMAKRRRRTQAEEVIRMLEREGFTEVPPEKIKEEPYRTIYALPSCFDEPSKKHGRRGGVGEGEGRSLFKEDAVQTMIFSSFPKKL